MMTQDFDIEALVAGFPSSMVHKGPPPGVYEIKGGSKEVRRPLRVEFIQQLFERFPVRLIWLKDFLKENMKETLRTPLSTCGGAGIWALPDEVSLAQLLDGLYEGGWAMFFLPNPPQKVQEAPEFLPIKPEEALSLLRTFGASVGIFSWYDDIDWLIVSSPQHH
jgi:hypothetical protein